MIWRAFRFLFCLLIEDDETSKGKCTADREIKIFVFLLVMVRKKPLQCLRGGIVLKGKIKTTGSSTPDKLTRLLILFNINFGFSSNRPSTSS